MARASQYPVAGQQNANTGLVIDRAVYILEEIDAQRWLRIHELTTIHLRGDLSYEGWKAACSAIIEHVARRLEP